MVDDLISRQAAIETLRAYFVDNFDYYIEDTKWIDEVLGTVPTVQPEREKGRWIDMGDYVMCSCCGATHYGVDKNYCPNCGVDMRKDEEHDE